MKLEGHWACAVEEERCLSGSEDIEADSEATSSCCDEPLRSLRRTSERGLDILRRNVYVSPTEKPDASDTLALRMNREGSLMH